MSRLPTFAGPFPFRVYGDGVSPSHQRFMHLFYFICSAERGKRNGTYKKEASRSSFSLAPFSCSGWPPSGLTREGREEEGVRGMLEQQRLHWGKKSVKATLFQQHK